MVSERKRKYKLVKCNVCARKITTNEKYETISIDEERWMRRKKKKTMTTRQWRKRRDVIADEIIIKLRRARPTIDEDYLFKQREGERDRKRLHSNRGGGRRRTSGNSARGGYKCSTSTTESVGEVVIIIACKCGVKMQVCVCCFCFLRRPRCSVLLLILMVMRSSSLGGLPSHLILILLTSG